MKNILLILVGGTICTALNNDGNLSVSSGAGALIKENFINSDSVFSKEVNIDLSENLFILSENMTVEKWNLIINTYKEYSCKEQYDGIIFAHGTDTLGFSAALFAQLLSDTEIPVFFVSANKPLSSCDSNGNNNFRCAVECICRGIVPNVYVAYKNISDKKMYLHLASRVTQCGDYSEDFFSSGMVEVGDGDYLEKIKTLYPADKRKSVVNINSMPLLKDNVLILKPYVGLNYEAINFSLFKAVLHGTYHSGTVCAIDKENKESALYMLNKCKGKTQVYFAPALQKTGTYETVAEVGKLSKEQGGVYFLYGTTTETAYAKLLIAYNLFDTIEETESFLKGEQNFENIY
jgi:L-asparaginase